MERKRRLTTIPVPVLIGIVSSTGGFSMSQEDALMELGRVFLWEDNGPAHTLAEECLAGILGGTFSPRSKCVALHCLTQKEAYLLTSSAKKTLAEFLTSTNPEHKEIIYEARKVML
ncbi:TPA: hypothetical protein DEP58_02495 [Patescibacteria group bacterium]|nr:MAG: hypothetical protein UU98_C0042G0005 [Parcubacteria group bacterium GW2011_GWD2_42_14]HCC05153.1 hypothetical protein [Patescibacteria group bacterium]